MTFLTCSETQNVNNNYCASSPSPQNSFFGILAFLGEWSLCNLTFIPKPD